MQTFATEASEGRCIGAAHRKVSAARPRERASAIEEGGAGPDGGGCDATISHPGAYRGRAAPSYSSYSSYSSYVAE
jgi:hypothetical protein